MTNQDFKIALDVFLKSNPDHSLENLAAFEKTIFSDKSDARFMLDLMRSSSHHIQAR